LAKIDGVLNSVLNNIEGCLVLTDTKNNIVFVNNAAIDLLQTSAADVLGKSALDVLTFFPEEESLNVYYYENKPISVKILKLKTGIEYFVEVKVKKLEEQGGGHSIFFRDVTMSELYTTKLQKSEEKYRGLFQNALEGIIVLDDDGKIVDVNPTACSIYGIGKEQFTKLTVGDIFPHKTNEESKSIWNQFRREGKIGGFYKYPRKKGEYRYIDFKAKSNFIAGFHLGIFTDVTEKREIENALRTSETQMKAIFNSSSQKIVLLDMDYKIVQVNKKALESSRQLGAKILMPGTSILEYANKKITPSGKEGLFLEKAKCGAVSRFEYIPYPEQPNYWIEVIVSPVYAKNKVKYICINTVDISLRKKAEITLLESEARFKSLVQNSSDVIMLISSASKIKYYSPSISKVLGYNEDTLIGKDLVPYIYKPDRAKFEEAVRYVIKEKIKTHAIEVKVLSASDDYKSLEIVLNNQLENSFIEGIVLNARDISARKKQEESLLLLERAIDSCDNGILITDPNQINNPIIYANRAFEKLTGYTYKEVVGKNSDFLVGADSGTMEADKIRKAVRSKSNVALRIKNYKKNGLPFWNDLTLSPVFNKDKELTNFIGVMQDVTERKLVEDILHIVNQDIAQAAEKEFFEILATQLGTLLKLDSIIISELTEEKKLLTKALFLDGKLQENKLFSLNLTPCQTVISKGKPIVLTQLSKEFQSLPWIADNKFTKYIGIPLIASNGRSVGVIAALSREGFKDCVLVERLLNLFSARTGAVLEREQYLKVLLSSEAKFRSLAETSPDYIFIVDAFTLQISYANKALFFGQKLLNLKTPLVTSLVHPHDLEILKEKWNKILKGEEENNSLDYRIKTKSGTYAWVASNHTVLEKNEGVVSKILLTTRVITDRKKYEKALQESEGRLVGLIENTKDLLWSVNKDLIFTTMNTAFKAFIKQQFKLTVKPGQNIREILPAKVRDVWIENHQRSLSGERFVSDFQLNIKNKEISFEIAYNPILSGKEISGVSVFARDITQRKIAENNIIQTNFELDSFVYRASHDLRAPLRSVLGLINLTKKEKEEAQRNMYLALAEKSIGKLDSFIADLTNFSRNTRMEVSSRRIDFNQVIGECFDHLMHMENAGNLKMTFSVREKYPFYSDPIRISIINQNLGSNGIKYYNAYSEASVCHVEVILQKNCAKIYVRDNGKGIKNEYFDAIFNMFFRASEEAYGSGLGLYITKQVVEKLNGEISVKSQTGKGSEFSVVLPNANPL